MKGAVPLGRILGVPLRIHWSAPLLVLLLADSLSSSTLPAWAPGHSTTAYTTAGLVGALLLMASLLAHEAAHAVTARRAGIKVEDVTVWGLGGVTRMGRAQTPRVGLSVSAIGPLTSLALGGVAIAAGLATQHALHWAIPSAVLLWTGWANLLLGAFNLLPAAPLDGGRVLQAVLWWRRGDREQAQRIAGRTGQVAGTLMAVAGWVELTHGASAGLWLILVGFFISLSAVAEVRRATLETALRGVLVAQAMSSPVTTGADWLTVDRFLDEAATKGRHSAIPLLDFDGHPSGIVELRRLSAVPPARRAELRARDGATPLARCAQAAPDDTLLDALERPGVTTPLRILVLDAGRLVGIVTGHDISRIAQQRVPEPHATGAWPTG
ncbi:site-2 protease family protein [Kitasatospora mediocidica]|uniref:site-2 protease family protein n=1 Tax=Kitasatospora mediocidica TaxID=58352 RepID=UPI000689994D|nr:site-2 protease family protein [Kitasatospora mediocidica]